MRLFLALVGLLLAGCVGPHSTGGLWAQQNLEQEAAVFRLTDAQRADQAHVFELGLADESLAAEQARIRGELQQTCPGSTRQPLTPSPGDKVRDTIRVRVQDDPARIAAVAQVALADWRLRRARATGESRFCDDARAALMGQMGEPAASHVLDRPGLASLVRDPRRPATASDRPSDKPVIVDVSLYASGWADSVVAAAPLPQYLAAVYGGVVRDQGTWPSLDGRLPEVVVDEIAPAYPAWEPDALYAVFSLP
jgi:hypothetical protein